MGISCIDCPLFRTATDGWLHGLFLAAQTGKTDHVSIATSLGMADSPDDRLETLDDGDDVDAEVVADAAAPPSATTALEDLQVLCDLDPSAERVTLRSKRLTAIDAELAFLGAHFANVRHLDLSDNALLSLPAGLGQALPKLVALDLSRNAHAFRSLAAVAAALQSCASLKSLSLPLKSPQDEQLLLALLPGLRILNGVPLDQRQGGDASVASPVGTSPQAKRDLKLRFDALSFDQNRPAVKASSGNNSRSVRPTEQPASISDDRTDWDKLLKGGKLDVPPPLKQHLLSTEAFLDELKTVVRAFHNAGRKGGNGQVMDQIDKQVEQLAAQLEAQERKGKATERSSVLQTRWRLLELCGAFGADQAATIDSDLGAALARLLRLQKEVLAAMTGGIPLPADPPAKQADKSKDSASQQQLKALLAVAEGLEGDLEALQLQCQQEQARRALLEQENATLRRQIPSPSANQKPAAKSSESTRPPSPVNGHAVRQPRRQHNSTSKTASTHAIPSSERRSRDQRNGEAVQLMVEKPVVGGADMDHEPGTHAAPSARPATVRSLTRKQLLDLVRGIQASKAKADARLAASGAPRETMEQHMYAYLNTRFGLQQLIVDYASAVWAASERLAPQDNEAAVFLALLCNQLDEGFLAIKRKLQRALVDLLRAYLQAKHPLDSEVQVAARVKDRVARLIGEDEWTEVLTYLYEPNDVRVCADANGWVL